ncbi:MAG: 50S ribosomal protein L25 [Candidatus Omnitrophota bacterium]
MEQIELTLETRTVKGGGAIARMRKSGVIPAVIYGEGETPVSVQLFRKDFERIERHHETTSAIYHLSIMDGGKKQKDVTALLKETQHNPVSDLVSHLDFMRISMDKEITIKVPIILKGEALGLKKEGSTLEHMLRELEIICLPKNIPAHLEVDVTSVDTHVSIHVNDLNLPEGVRTKMDPGATIVALVFSDREVEAAASADVAAKPDLEVIKEKPKDAAAGAAPAAGAKAAAKPEAKK